MSKQSAKASRARSRKKSGRRKKRACICLECGFTEHLPMDAWRRLMARARELEARCPVHGTRG